MSIWASCAGLAYYTGFVFEAFDMKGELRASRAAGRYDHLVAKLGGPELPAAGFAIGDMTFALLLEQRGLMPATVQAPDVYAVMGGPAERLAAFGDIHALRSAGFRVEYPFKDIGFGKQFKAAAESGARLALIYGSDEVARGVVKFRDLTERSERDVPKAEVPEAVKDFFSRGDFDGAPRPAGEILRAETPRQQLGKPGLKPLLRAADTDDEGARAELADDLAAGAAGAFGSGVGV